MTDYWQILVDNGCINIYNPAKYHHCENGESCDLSEISTKDIINQTIIKIEAEEHNYVEFRLSNNNSICISIADNDYTGPEAYEVWLETGEIIVE